MLISVFLLRLVYMGLGSWFSFGGWVGYVGCWVVIIVVWWMWLGAALGGFGLLWRCLGLL